MSILIAYSLSNKENLLNKQITTGGGGETIKAQLVDFSSSQKNKMPLSIKYIDWKLGALHYTTLRMINHYSIMCLIRNFVLLANSR